MFSREIVMLEEFNEELKEAEAMVKGIPEDQVPLLMLRAMAASVHPFKGEKGWGSDSGREG